MTKYEYNLTNNGIMDYADAKNVKDGSTIENAALTFPRYAKLGSYTEYDNISAFVSAQVSDTDGVFEQCPILIAEFKKRKNCNGVSLIFNNVSNDYPETIEITWKNKEETILVETVTCEEPSVRTYTRIEGFTSCLIKFISTNKAYRPIFISKLSFVSLAPYDGFKIVYNGIAPGAEENMMISSDDAEPTLSWLPWTSTGENNNIALPLPNYSILDGSVKDSTGEYMAGFVSEEISNAEGLFNKNPKLSIVINDGYYTSNGINILFDPNGREYLKEVVVRWYRDLELLSEKAYTPNSNEYFCAKTVNNFNIVEIECVKTYAGYRRAIVRRVQIGHTVTYTQKDITKNNVIVEVSPIGEELSTNTMSFELQGISEAPVFQKGQKIELFYDGIQQGAFYISEGQQNSRVTYSVKANDAMELLQGDFYGIYRNGYYVAEYDCTLEDFVGYVLEGTNISFEIEEEAKTLRIKGVLPIMSRKDALQQAAFATGAIIDTFGDEKIKVVASKGKSVIIGDDDILNLSVNTLTPCSKLEVTAYTVGYEDARELYNDIADGIVKLSNPAKITSWNLSIAAPTLCINAVEANGTTTINGKSVQYGESVYTKINETIQSANIDTEIETVSDAYFVNVDNVGIVADRVYAYYASSKEVTVETYDTNIAPRDNVSVLLWDGTLFTGTVRTVISRYTNRLYSEIVLR